MTFLFNKKNKGFSLIELLIVIAVIGILSSIVIISLTGAKNKSRDAKVISQLSRLREAGYIYYLSHDNSYVAEDGTTNICTEIINASEDPSGVGRLVRDFKDTIVCRGPIFARTFAVSALLPSGAYWCVDSTGTSKRVTRHLIPADSKCP
jgi:prepilin-type N-terminal cleavage/methylation domain-containing protein